MASGLKDIVEGLDDVKDFAVMEKSMTDCGFDPKEKSNVFRISAAVLHIGNLDFAESGEGSALAPTSEATLSGLAGMLGLDLEAMRSALLTTVIVVGGTESKKAKTKQNATFGRDALSKALYSKLFDWIVRRVNKCFPFPQASSQNFIGILDIAGFEYFQVCETSLVTADPSDDGI